MINYFVSYFYKTTTYQEGFGSLVCKCKRFINTEDDIKEIIAEIAHSGNYAKIIILNLTLLGAVEKESEGDNKC